MNDIIKGFIKSLSNSTLSLKKKGILIDKPWILIEKADTPKYIFRKDESLMKSIKGEVSDGKWEYFPEAKSLLITVVEEKILLNELYIDDNILVMQKDGVEFEPYTFVNEKTIPDLNALHYLYSLECEKNNIFIDTLLDDKVINIINVHNERLDGKQVKFVDEFYNKTDPPNGKYISANLRTTYFIRNNRLERFISNTLISLADKKILVIEADQYNSKLNKYATIDGVEVGNIRVVTKSSIVYYLKDSHLNKIRYHRYHTLSDGRRIKIEQEDNTRISKGDKIVESGHLPDGKYKIKGIFLKKRIINMKIGSQID